MLLAAEEIPTFAVTVIVIGGLIGTVAGLLACANYIKQLFFAVPEGQQAVLKKDFAEALLEIRSEIKSTRTERIEQMVRMTESIAAEREYCNVQIAKVTTAALQERDYSHEQTHLLRTSLQLTTNELGFIKQWIDTGLKEAIHRLEERYDHTERALAKMGQRLSKLMGQLSKSIKNGDDDNGDGDNGDS